MMSKFNEAADLTRPRIQPQKSSSKIILRFSQMQTMPKPFCRATNREPPAIQAPLQWISQDQLALALTGLSSSPGTASDTT
jgi:hypothetical protein